MRHKIKRKHLGRSPKHLKSMKRNLLTALATHERITTTLAKAKYIQPFADKLINKGRFIFLTTAAAKQRNH